MASEITEQPSPTHPGNSNDIDPRRQKLSDDYHLLVRVAHLTILITEKIKHLIKSDPRGWHDGIHTQIRQVRAAVQIQFIRAYDAHTRCNAPENSEIDEDGVDKICAEAQRFAKGAGVSLAAMGRAIRAWKRDPERAVGFCEQIHRDLVEFPRDGRAVGGGYRGDDADLARKSQLVILHRIGPSTANLTLA